MTTQPNGHSSPGAVRDDVGRARSEMREIGSSTADIAADLRDLGRLEMELAKAEVAENTRRLVRGAIWGVVAGVFAFWLLGFLGTALMLGLATVFAGWVAALITAGVVLLLAAIAGGLAYWRFKQFSPTPQRTIGSLRKDMEWARGLMKQNGGSANSER